MKYQHKYSVLFSFTAAPLFHRCRNPKLPDCFMPKQRPPFVSAVFIA